MSTTPPPVDDTSTQGRVWPAKAFANALTSPSRLVDEDELNTLRVARDDAAGHSERSPHADRNATNPAGSERLTQMLEGDERARVQRSPSPDRALVGLVLSERWRLEERVGVGGGGEVWRALDLQEGGEVAVKLLSPALSQSSRHVRRFRREFRTLSGLSHGACLRVIAEGAAPAEAAVEGVARRYLVTEWVAGGTLSRMVRAPTLELLPVLIELASALDYIHRQQIVHRDLKPNNVLLTLDEPPRVKLADFGISALRQTEQAPDDARSALTEAGALLGTLDYLSPEQVRGLPADPRSDLYAFGCLMYALWAGETPFSGSRMERLWRRVDVEAPSLAVAAPDAPKSVVELTAKLLQRLPERRVQSAYELSRLLSEILCAESAANAGEGAEEGANAQPNGLDRRAGDSDRRARPLHAPSAYGAFLYPPGLVGREHDLAASEAIASAVEMDGVPALLALVGDPGIGKTTLADAILARRVKEGWRSERLQVTPAIGPLEPFRSLELAAAAMASGVARTAEFMLDSITDPVVSSIAEALAEANPGARDAAAPGALLVPPSLPLGARPESEVRRAQQELAQRIVSHLCDPVKSPICVVLDDIHEASPNAIQVLAPLLAAATEAELPLLVVLTSRSHTRHLLTSIAAVQIMEIARLSDRASAQLVARMLGAAENELPRAMMEMLVREAGGNPLLLRTAVRNLVQEGELRRVLDGWELRPNADPRAVFRSMLERRLDALRPSTGAICRTAALVGMVFDAELVREVTGHEEEVLLDALADAVSGGVIVPVLVPRPAGDTRPHLSGLSSYRFTHARLAELLCRHMDAEERAKHHDAIADALARRGASAAELAYQYGRGSDPAKAVHHLRAAADEAREGHDQSAAATYLERLSERLLELPGSDAAARRRKALEERADALVSAGECVEAVAVLGELEAEARGSDAGRLLRKRGQALLRTGQPGAGMDALQSALVRVGDPTPSSRLGRMCRLSWDVLAAVVERMLPARGASTLRLERARAHRELSFMYRWVDLYDAAGHLVRFFRLAERSGPLDLRVDANTLATMLFALRSKPGAAEFFRARAHESAAASGDLVGLARLTVIQGACEALLLDSEGALARMDEGVALAVESGDQGMLCFALSGRAWIRGMVGSVPQANAEFAECALLAKEAGSVWMHADARCGQALSALVIGRVSEAQRIARSVLTSEVRLTFPVFEELAVEALAGVALFEGRYGDALAGYEHAHALLRKHHLGAGWGWLMPMELIESSCLLADTVGVCDLPRRLRRASKATRRMSRLPLYRGCADVARGVAASRSGNEGAARAHFAQGLAAREGGRVSHMDTWVRLRPAFERLRMGDERALITAEVEAVDAIYRDLELEGLRSLLVDVRGIYKV